MTNPALGWLLLAAPPAAVLGMVSYNLAVWPRGRVDGRFRGRLSVLIPARDEAGTIEACVRGALSGSVAPDEVLVYDDASRDGTGDIVRRLAREDRRVRLLSGTSLPSGWVGKPHACHRLAAAASGEVLLFIDADTVPTAEGLARVASLFEDYAADAVSVAPRQRMVSLPERIVIPHLHLTYLAWLPLPLIWRLPDPRAMVANGQMLAVRRRTYERVGGWGDVRAELVDDMAFCRLVKRAGGRVVFGDGHRMAHCRMYDGGRALRDGFSRSLLDGLGGRPFALAGALTLYGTVFLLPYLALPSALATRGGWVRPACAGVAANLLARALLAVRLRHPPESVLLHPLGALAVLGIGVRSYLWSRRDGIPWRGRRYPSRAARLAA